MKSMEAPHPNQEATAEKISKASPRPKGGSKAGGNSAGGNSGGSGGGNVGTGAVGRGKAAKILGEVKTDFEEHVRKKLYALVPEDVEAYLVDIMKRATSY